MKELFMKTFNPDFLYKLLFAGIILVAGLIIIRLATGLVLFIVKKRVNFTVKAIIRKIMLYLGNSIVILLALSAAGASLSAILGAAGVMGIAVGIASQASISNIISGLFLVSEKAFQLGDAITIGDTSGIVYSIDLLSVKIKTYDNLYVRVPNTTIINQDLVNISRFPLRRMDITLNLPFDTDLEFVKKLLQNLAFEQSSCLNNPEPLIVFQEFNQTGIKILFGIWFDKSDYLAARNGMFNAILTEFKKNGIAIAVPQITLNGGVEPVTVEYVNSSSE